MISSAPYRFRFATIPRPLPVHRDSLARGGSVSGGQVNTYIEVVEQLTECVTQGGGSAISFRATALSEADERTIADTFAAARREEYLQVVKSARKLREHITQEDEDRDYRFAEVESLEEELQKVRRQLALVVMRDVGPPANQAEATTAIEQAATRLQTYLENAYCHDRENRSNTESHE